jgi:hypothetical protein
MVLSAHSLAIERRRWKENGKKIVHENWRLCRFCYAYVKDPAHAMFVCQNTDLIPIRSMFFENIENLIPGIANQSPDALQTFKGYPARREITPLLAKLAFDVLEIFATPMTLPVYFSVSSPGFNCSRSWSLPPQLSRSFLVRFYSILWYKTGGYTQDIVTDFSPQNGAAT